MRHDKPSLCNYAARYDRWISVYGAMIAAQVQEYRNRTANCVDERIMEGFHEEAATIADMADDAGEKGGF